MIRTSSNLLKKIKQNLILLIKENWKNLKITFVVLELIWFLYLISIFVPLVNFYLVPRELSSLPKAFVFSFLHDDFKTMLINSIGFGLIYFKYINIEKEFKHLIFISLTSFYGLLMWIFARNETHWGLRGLIYGLFSYLLFKGIFEKKIKSLISSVLVLFAYHALLLEALPGGSKYYWEHEFIGFLSGIVIAKFKTILVKSFD